MTLTHKEHAARAMLLQNDRGEQLWYDSATKAYRHRSPGGSKYMYSGCLDADTLKPLEKGEALKREKPRKNTISNKRLGITDD